MTARRLGKPYGPNRTDRKHKRLVAAHVHFDIFDEFKLLVQAKDSTVDLEIHVAIALLFQEHNRPLPPMLELKLVASLERQKHYRIDPSPIVERLLLRRSQNENAPQRDSHTL
jgi:hypothetical protein